MLLPQAFIDDARAFGMGDYLTVLTEGQRLLAAHPRAGELERPGALLAGWARTIDDVIETAARAAPDDRRSFFARGEARKAISAMSAALGELKPEQLDASRFEGITPAKALLHAAAFVAEAEGLSASLDSVRAPAWRKQ